MCPGRVGEGLGGGGGEGDFSPAAAAFQRDSARPRGREAGRAVSGGRSLSLANPKPISRKTADGKERGTIGTPSLGTKTRPFPAWTADWAESLGSGGGSWGPSEFCQVKAARKCQKGFCPPRAQRIKKQFCPLSHPSFPRAPGTNLVLPSEEGSGLGIAPTHCGILLGPLAGGLASLWRLGLSPLLSAQGGGGPKLLALRPGTTTRLPWPPLLCAKPRRPGDTSVEF